MSESPKRPLLMLKPEVIEMISDYERIRGSKSDRERREFERQELDKLPAFDCDGIEIEIGDTVEFVKKQKNRKTTDGKHYEVLSKKRYTTLHEGGEVAILCDDGKIRGYSTRQVRLIKSKIKAHMNEFQSALEML